MKKMVIVRPNKPMTAMDFKIAHEYFARQTKFDVLVLPSPDFDVMTDPPPLQEQEPIEQDDIEAARAEILDAYNAGKIIQYNPIADPLAGWLDAHKHSSPHDFEWDDNYYRLYSPKR